MNKQYEKPGKKFLASRLVNGKQNNPGNTVSFIYIQGNKYNRVNK